MTLKRPLLPRIGVLLTAFALLPGCGDGGPKTHRVSGRVELPGTDASLLAGHNIEAALSTDPNVRASGVIGSDGRFVLETLQNGAMRRGAVAGTYNARLVLSDDDPASRRRVAQAIAGRYLKFETSGLTFQVPTSDDITLPLAPR
jgi:hypothetical protein